MTGVYNLNNGVDVTTLYKGLTTEQKETLEAVVADKKITEAELKKIEEAGIDKSLITNNFTKDVTADAAGDKRTQSKADVKSKIEELTRKYCKDLGKNGGDPYSTANPELNALNKMLDDGEIGQLAADGFTKTQILEIIAGAFPSVGIAPTGEDGSYTRPYGHGADAQKIYDRFTSQLVVATGQDSEEIKAAKAKLATINNQIASNNQNMQVLEVTIEALQEEVQEQLDKAIEDSKDIQEEHKQKAKDAVNNRLNEYTNSNGEMTYEEFQKNISSDLNGLQTKTGRALGDVVNDLVNANHKMNLLKGYVSDLTDLADNNKTLTDEAKATQTEITDLVKEQAAKAEAEGDCQAQCTDPIGFTTDAARYDFFVDTDNNKDITNEQEFLGAKDGFSEVKDLDANGDGLVTGEELDAGNVKVIKTNTDGTQEIVNASDVFKNATDGINLNSYQSTNQDIGEGNTLLGTFSATMDGQSMSGYQTLDSNEWLDKNYEFTDEVEGKGRFAQDGTDITEARDSSEKINLFTIKNTELEGKLSEAWNAWGFTDTMATQLVEASESEAKADGAKIQKGFDEIARKEEEKATQTEEERAKDKEMIEEKLNAKAKAEAEKAKEEEEKEKEDEEKED